MIMISIKEALTFDDVTLKPKYSNILPTEVNTETKLSKVSQFLTEDLERNTVDYRNHYDETEREPTVL